MIIITRQLYLTIFTLVVLLSGCQRQQIKTNNDTAAVIAVMQKHLDAVTNKDLASLKSTMSPDGRMQLLLPQTEIIDGVDGFMKFHEDWFALPDWTFETQILNSEVGSKLAMVIVEIIYREPNRDGNPYYNRMNVSYDLAKMNGQWYVIKDHASSIKKSTDK